MSLHEFCSISIEFVRYSTIYYDISTELVRHSTTIV